MGFDCLGRHEESLRDLAFVIPVAAIRAIRNSLAVSASRPRSASRRGRAPAYEELLARAPYQPGRTAVVGDVEPFPEPFACRPTVADLSSASLSTNARACSSLAGDFARTATACSRSGNPCLADSIVPATRRAIPVARWAWTARARSNSCCKSSGGLSFLERSVCECRG